MFIIAKMEADQLLFDILSEDDGTPIVFLDEEAAMKYINVICQNFGIEPLKYMEDDSIIISRVH
jgi:hypothetical protein|tara:strand:+ start:548 stop:739 length:192 start_codon:yes stop_codon:yes gene_type:complete